MPTQGPARHEGHRSTLEFALQSAVPGRPVRSLPLLTRCQHETCRSDTFRFPTLVPQRPVGPEPRLLSMYPVCRVQQYQNSVSLRGAKVAPDYLSSPGRTSRRHFDLLRRELSRLRLQAIPTCNVLEDLNKLEELCVLPLCLNLVRRFDIAQFTPTATCATHHRRHRELDTSDLAKSLRADTFADKTALTLLCVVVPLHPASCSLLPLWFHSHTLRLDT